MSTLTAPAPAPAAVVSARAHHLSFPRVLHAEWIKFWSLRSTVWTVAATVVVMGAVSWLAAFFTAREATNPGTKPQDAAELTRLLHDPGLILTGTELAKLVVAVLGVLIITGEYSTGMIRSTLTAVPRRLPALWAKALVLFAVTTGTVVVAEVLSWLVAAPTLHSHDAVLDLGSAETQRILLGGVLYLAGIALLAFAVGAIIRVAAGRPRDRARAAARRRGPVPHPAGRLLPPGQPVPARHRRAPAARHPVQHRAGPRHQQAHLSSTPGSGSSSWSPGSRSRSPSPPGSCAAATHEAAAASAPVLSHPPPRPHWSSAAPRARPRQPMLGQRHGDQLRTVDGARCPGTTSAPSGTPAPHVGRTAASRPARRAIWTLPDNALRNGRPCRIIGTRQT